MTIEPCFLCGKQSELQDSHIIPKFVFKWLKDTSATGYLRHSKRPNKRVQDGLKYPLLCSDCEQRFSRWEAEFANTIFYPFTNATTVFASYGKWFLLFCTSISWRVLKHALVTNLNNIPKSILPLALQTEEIWREFLLGKRPHPAQHEQHFLPFAAVDAHTFDDMPTNINRYFLRSTEIDIGNSERIAFTYSKLGPFAILGFILVDERSKFQQTKVHVNQGTIKPQQYILPIDFGDYLIMRANKSASVIQQISEQQKALISTTFRKNLDRAANSQSMKVFDEDFKLFGKDAFNY